MAAGATTLPTYATRDSSVDTRAYAAADRFLAMNRKMGDRSYWGVRMFVSLNLFLWHLDAVAGGREPVAQFVDVFDRSTSLLAKAQESGLCQSAFPHAALKKFDASTFESEIAGLFSDVWVGFDDATFFDEPYDFTRRRFELNGIDPEVLFKGKTIVDAGCGSGKYSIALAKFGAKKVIGLDIGEKGLQFARDQAKKVPHGTTVEFRNANLLEIPLADSSVDFVWSNGVIHHTLDYERCLAEFSRILKPGGELFIYVDGRFGLFEVLCDTLVAANQDIPRALFQHYLITLGMNSGRIYWVMDCLFAPYERYSKNVFELRLKAHKFGELRQLTRGIDIDQIEWISAGKPYADIWYGEAQLRYLARKT